LLKSTAAKRSLRHSTKNEFAESEEATSKREATAAAKSLLADTGAALPKTNGVPALEGENVALSLDEARFGMNWPKGEATAAAKSLLADTGAALPKTNDVPVSRQDAAFCEPRLARGKTSESAAPIVGNDSTVGEFPTRALAGTVEELRVLAVASETLASTAGRLSAAA